MRSVKNLLALALAADLILLSPGLGAYAAAAGVLRGAPAPGRAAPSAAAGAAGRLSPAVPASFRLAPLSPSLAPSSLPGASAPKTVSQGVAAAVSPAVRAAEAVSRVSRIGAAPATAVLQDRTSLPAARAPPAPGRKLSSAVQRRAAGRGTALLPSLRSMGTGRIGASQAFDGEFRRGAARTGTAVSATDGGETRRSGLAASRQDGMPDQTPPPSRGSDVDVSDLDELGNPKRTQSPGPDDRTVSPGRGFDDGAGRRGNSDLFALAAPVLGTAALFAAAPLFPTAGLGAVALWFGVFVPSMILHEMGHAWAALRLTRWRADDGADLGPGYVRYMYWREEVSKRLSLRPSDLLSHFGPFDEYRRGRITFGQFLRGGAFASLVLPFLVFVATKGAAMLGGMRPIRIPTEHFRPETRERDFLLAVAAGPAVNFGLALGAGLTLAGVAAAGVTGLLPLVLILTVWANSLLLVFNLLPFNPLDGHFFRDALLKKAGQREFVDFLKAVGSWQLVGLFVAVMAIPAVAAAFIGLVNWTAGLFLWPASLVAGSVQAGEGTPFQRVEETPNSKTLIVRLPENARGSFTEDLHLGSVDVRDGFDVEVYRGVQDRIEAQLRQAGAWSILAALRAAPIAVYRDINATTIRVPLVQVASLRSMLESLGYKVYENERREIIPPIEDDPSIQEPLAADPQGPVTMEETLKITGMDKVHEIARKTWGSRNMGRMGRALLLALGVAIPQPKAGVMDTGVDMKHPLIRLHVAAAKDIRPAGDGADDNGHGTWVVSQVANFAPWANNITSYKAFTNGGATLDDVLKGLAMVENDGNILGSHSWGSNAGDPESLDSLKFKAMAERMTQAAAAGNNGYAGANTIGSPAIVHHRAPNGAQRVIAVGATDRHKRIVAFSSKGPGSRVTKSGGKWEGYRRKPDAAEQGYQTEGAWPGGGKRAISGTSMSTPKLAGTILMLAQLFGVTEAGAKLDRIVAAVMGTLTNEHGQSDTHIGDGFVAAYAAYEALLEQGFLPAGPRGIRRRLADWVIRLFDRG